MQSNIQYITWLQISFTAKIMKQYQSLDSPERRKLRLECGARITSDDADRLVVEPRFVGVDHRRQPLCEIGGSRGRDEQDLGPVAGDPPGLRVAPLAFAVKDGEAVGEVRRDGLRGKLGPFGIAQRLTPFDAAAEEQLGVEHPLFRRQ